jgi:hypothetical protein
MSSVGGWKVEARRFSGRRGSASSTVTGTPALASTFAAHRPTGPAPATITTACDGALIDKADCDRIN